MPRQTQTPTASHDILLKVLIPFWTKGVDIPAIHLVRLNDVEEDNSPTISDALELYLRLKGIDKDKTFIRTANRNIEYIIKVLGNKSIRLYSSSVIKPLEYILLFFKLF